MQGQFSHDQPYYRCRYPTEYALANHVQHPRNVYLAEQEVLPLLDAWLLRAFAPHRLTDTVARLHAAQPAELPAAVEPATDEVEALIAGYDAKLTRYRAIADAGGDPATIAGWIAEVNAQRAAAVARRKEAPAKAGAITRLSPADIQRLVGSFECVREAVAHADPAAKGEVYRQLRLTMSYHPAHNRIRVVATPDADSCGVLVRVRGGN
jgi:site-specific DNA recombinase